MLPLDILPHLVRALLAAGAEATAARLCAASRGCRAAGRGELLRSVCARGWRKARRAALLGSAGDVRRLSVACNEDGALELVRACLNVRALEACAWEAAGARGLLAALPSLRRLEELDVELGAGWESTEGGEPAAVAFPPSLRRAKVRAVSGADAVLRALEAAPGLRDLDYVAPDFGAGGLAAFPGLLGKLDALETDAADLAGLPPGLRMRMGRLVLRSAEELDLDSWANLCSALEADVVVLAQTSTSRVLAGLPRAGTVVFAGPMPDLSPGDFSAAVLNAALVPRLVFAVSEGSPAWEAAAEERELWRSLGNVAWIGCGCGAGTGGLQV
ncbi:hypothetical protein DFJ74DRAFT_771593 [Hyaloraphidium curvatum]|nr:hypothetical protein DFJ74DRAFT_771593 [Hyaloraphidium curvatum]